MLRNNSGQFLEKKDKLCLIQKTHKFMKRTYLNAQNNVFASKLDDLL